MPNPIVLIHGYSDKGGSFRRWAEALCQSGYDVTAIHTCNYESLTNEVTLPDIAEGFDRALRIRAGLDEDQEFDAIVHSTGMLVVRAWLAKYAQRRSRLKHLIGLAPASFGSPLAHKGRSWLGAIFKGRRELGPDFLEAGNRVLEGLELGSRFTWDLAHTDLIGAKPCFGPDGDTPYVFTFCGTEGYGGLRSLAHEDGSDGTVRWAACPLNTRKIIVDLTVEPELRDGRKRFDVAPWSNVDIPLIPVAGVNHGSILQKPPDALVGMVRSALRVSTRDEFEAWHREAARSTVAVLEGTERWQQFVIRATDERGDPIPDYNVQLFSKSNRGRAREIREFDMHVHPYGPDPSLRCFHVNLDRVRADRLPNLWIRVIASSGSRLVGYHGYGSDKISPNGNRVHRNGKWDAEVNISELLTNRAMKFFYPFTTTLIELKLNREPLPLVGRNDVAWFGKETMS